MFFLQFQLIINKEFGVTKNENPLQGSFIIDELTNLVEEAVLNEFDKITARTKKLEISLNEEENLGSLIIILKSCQNRPPDYLPESAAYIEIFDLLNQSEDKQNLVFSGWMFSSSPAISALEHPIYDISLVSCK